MPDREKVLHELDHQVADADWCDNEWKDNVPIWMLRGALALLREQEPRVMTLEEVHEDELVWIEVPQSDEIWPALLREADWFGHPKWEMCGFAIARSFLHEGYGRDWRCWTGRPTDEQRRAVKWE